MYEQLLASCDLKSKESMKVLAKVKTKKKKRKKLSYYIINMNLF